MPRRKSVAKERVGVPDPDTNIQPLPPWITPEERERRFRMLEAAGIGRDGFRLKQPVREITAVRSDRPKASSPSKPRQARTA